VKRPFLMPVLAGLLDGETGAELVGTTLLELSQAEQDFTFELAPGLTKPPVLSVLRGFSAPVIRSESACFAPLFMLKMIVLPRQARDEHTVGKSLKKDWCVFFLIAW
jgi:aminopeptidase N